MTKIETIPALLQSIPNWLRFRIVWKEGSPRPDKLNYCLATGRMWEKGDPLATYEAATWGLPDDEYLGFRIMTEDRVACLDLDEVRDATTGEIEAEALAIVKDFNSYTEVSISGSGLHIFLTVREPLPASARTKRTKCRLKGYEFYHRTHFMLMTGDHLLGTPDNLRDRTALALETIKPAVGEYDTGYHGGKSQFDARTVLNLIRLSGSSYTFFKRFNSEPNVVGERSDIDFYLAATLARYTNCDPRRIEEIMRMSRRVRDDWNKGVYLQRTIVKACLAVETRKPVGCLTGNVPVLKY